MPKYIRTPQNTLIFSLKVKKVAGNKERFERKNRFCGGMGLGGGESLFRIFVKSLIVKK